MIPALLLVQTFPTLYNSESYVKLVRSILFLMQNVTKYGINKLYMYNLFVTLFTTNLDILFYVVFQSHILFNQYMRFIHYDIITIHMTYISKTKYMIKI